MSMDPGDKNEGSYRPAASSRSDEHSLADVPVQPHTMAGYKNWSSYGCHRPQWQQYPTGFATANGFGGEKRSVPFSPKSSSQEGIRHGTTIEPLSRKIAPLTPTDTVSCLKLASQASAHPSLTLVQDGGNTESLSYPSSDPSRDYFKDDTSKPQAKLSKHDSPHYMIPHAHGIPPKSLNNVATVKTVGYATVAVNKINDDCSESCIDDDYSAYTEGIASIASDPRVIAIGILAEAPPPDPQVQQDQNMLSQVVANDLAEKEHHLKMQRQEAAMVERRLLNSRIAASIAKRDSRLSSTAMHFEPRRSSIDSFKKPMGKLSLSNKHPGEQPTKLPFAKFMSFDEVQSSDNQELQVTPRMRGRKSTLVDRQEKLKAARGSMTRVDDHPQSYSIPSSTPPKLPIRKHSGSEMLISDDVSVDAHTEGGDITAAASSACSVVTSSSGIDLDDITRDKIIARSASLHMARRQRSLLATDENFVASKASIASKDSMMSISERPKNTVRTLSATSSTSSSHSRRSSRKDRASLRVSLTGSVNSKTKEDLLLVGANQEPREQDDDLPFRPVMSTDFAHKDDDEEEVERLNLEAQAGIPVVLPGAFAVRPINASTSMHSSGYDSGFEEDSVASAEENMEAEVSSNIDVLPQRSSTLRPVVSHDPVQAELYQVDYADAEVVDAAASDSDKSTRKRTRRLFAAMLFIVIALSTGIAMMARFLGENNDPKCNQECVPTIVGWQQVGESLIGPTNRDNIQFGRSVAMSGDGKRVAIGLPGFDIIHVDETISQAGSVMILEFNGTSWTTIAELEGLEVDGNAGSAVVMSKDGTRVAFGAPNAEGGGYVAMYEEGPDGTWSIVGDVLHASGISGSTAFGMSLSLSADGRVLAVGDRYATLNGNQTKVGSIRMFRQENATWEILGEKIHGQQANDFFGWSVALSQDGLRVAASAIGSNDQKGEVRIFDFIGGAWVQLGSNLVGEAERENFGASLAMDKNGTFLAIGANGYSKGGTASSVGRVLTYQYDDQTKDWIPLSDPIEGDKQFDRFGSSVALSANGTVLSIGSQENDDFGTDAGFIAIMQYDGISWSRIGSKLGRQDSQGGLFGFSIAMSTDGNRVVGGAPELTFDGKFSKVGRAWVYEREAV